MQQRAARSDAFDHCLSACPELCRRICCASHFHHIAACHFAFFAARQAGDFATVGKAHQILAAKRRNNLCAEKPVLRVPGQKFFGSRVEGFAQSLNSVSTFAAQMKSFSDRPWMASVVYSTWQLL